MGEGAEALLLPLFIPGLSSGAKTLPHVAGKPETITPDFREKRHLSRKAIIVGGGVTEADNYVGFYLDTLLWYYLCRDVLLIPDQDIAVLYFNGRSPQEDRIVQAAATQPLQTYLEFLFNLYPPRGLPVAAPAAKEDFLATLNRFAAATSDQLLLFRSGHGSLSWSEAPDGQRYTYSIMKFLGEQMVTSAEYAEALRKNQAEQIITFLNQCDALFFQKLPVSVPNLVMFTSNSGSGVNEPALQDTRVNLSWPWSQATRDAFLHPQSADYHNNGLLNLLEIQQYIVAHDYMATVGFNAEWSMEPVRTHPGLSYGSAIDPGKIVLLQYQ